jgi:large subunit ribosomal protein L28
MFPTLPSLASLPFSQPFKRAALGLFHGKTKQYGNNVPFSKHKTRRTWLPNAHNKSLYSEIMGGWIKANVTARALKTIDKVRAGPNSQ